MILEQNKQKRKINFLTSYFKDWRTYYKILAALLIAIALIYALVDALVNIADAKLTLDNGQEISKWAIQTYNDNGVLETHYDYPGLVVSYFSYFTIQSNILVLIWWLVILIWPWKEGKKGLASTKNTNYIITYISITMCVFCFLLLPNAFSGTIEISSGYWFILIITHMVGPLATIIYALFFMNKYKFYAAKKEWAAKKVWWVLLYPFCYGIYIIIRGELRYAAGHVDQLSYPYFFLWFRTKSWGLSGAAWFPIVGTLIFVSAVLLSILFIVIFTKLPNKKLTTKFTETYEAYQKQPIKTERKVSNF